MASVRTDAILATVKSDKGAKHISIVSQDIEGVWYYFLGDKIEFYDSVPPEAMENIDTFNAQLLEIRINNPQRQKIPRYYTYATYVEGNLCEITRYYKERVDHHSAFGYYWILNYCSVVSSKALSFGTLFDEIRFQDLVDKNRTISRSDTTLRLVSSKFTSFGRYEV